MSSILNSAYFLVCTSSKVRKAKEKDFINTLINKCSIKSYGLVVVRDYLKWHIYKTTKTYHFRVMTLKN